MHLNHHQHQKGTCKQKGPPACHLGMHCHHSTVTTHAIGSRRSATAAVSPHPARACTRNQSPRWRCVTSSKAQVSSDSAGGQTRSQASDSATRGQTSHQEPQSAGGQTQSQAPARYAIIGAGLAGIATAWHLLRAHEEELHAAGVPQRPVEVHVFEAWGIASGGSGAAAGLLHPFSPKGKLLWKGAEALAAALETVEAAEAAAQQQQQQQQQAGSPAGHQTPFVWRNGMVRPANSVKQAADFAKATRGAAAAAAAATLVVTAAAAATPAEAAAAAAATPAAAGAPAAAVAAGAASVTPLRSSHLAIHTISHSHMDQLIPGINEPTWLAEAMAGPSQGYDGLGVTRAISGSSSGSGAGSGGEEARLPRRKRRAVAAAAAVVAGAASAAGTLAAAGATATATASPAAMGSHSSIETTGHQHAAPPAGLHIPGGLVLDVQLYLTALWTACTQAAAQRLPPGSTAVMHTRHVTSLQQLMQLGSGADLRGAAGKGAARIGEDGSGGARKWEGGSDADLRGPAGEGAERMGEGGSGGVRMGEDGSGAAAKGKGGSRRADELGVGNRAGGGGWDAVVVAAGAAAGALPELQGRLPLQLCQGYTLILAEEHAPAAGSERSTSVLYPAASPSILGSTYIAAQHSGKRLVIGATKAWGITADQALQCGAPEHRTMVPDPVVPHHARGPCDPHKSGGDAGVNGDTSTQGQGIPHDAHGEPQDPRGGRGAAQAAAEQLCGTASAIWAPAATWRMHEVRSGVRALPPRTPSGSLPLLGCLGPYENNPVSQDTPSSKRTCEDDDNRRAQGVLGHDDDNSRAQGTVHQTPVSQDTLSESRTGDHNSRDQGVVHQTPVWLFAGLGSRGLVYHAFLARQLARAIVTGDRTQVLSELQSFLELPVDAPVSFETP